MVLHNTLCNVYASLLLIGCFDSILSNLAKCLSNFGQFGICWAPLLTSPMTLTGLINYLSYLTVTLFYHLL